MSVKKTILLFAVLVVQYATGLDFCRAEDIPKCAQRDTSCLINNLESQVRKWLLKGQPGYFTDPMDVISFDELQIPTTNGVYLLKHITVKGFADARLTDLNFNLENFFTNFTYVFDFDVTAKELLNDKGKSVLQVEPLAIHMTNITAKTTVFLEIVNRCEKSFMKFNKVEINIRDVNNEDILVKHILEGPHDEILKVITKTVAEATSRKITDMYGALAKIIPISAFLL